MNQSPVQFARDFAKLKSDLARSPVPDHMLLALMTFWPRFETVLMEPAFRSYVDEYLPLLLHCTSAESLFDFSIAELTALKDALARLQVWTKGKPIDEQVAQKAGLVTFRLATVLLYAGSIEDALPLVALLAGERRVPKFDSARLEGLGSFEALRMLADDIIATSPAVGRILRDIFERWEAERGCVHHDRIWCLFVEKSERGRVERGRLKALHGTVEAFRREDEEDIVSFDNQIRTPDDPFVGVAYNALDAVGTVLGSAGVGWKKDKCALRAFLSIADARQTFTGDSIGLAVGLVSYTQLLKPYVMRQERFIASEAAVTGGVDARGRLVAVNESTLACKVERAFFSHVKYLVLPEGNLAEAKRCVDKLKRSFPRRRLRLIGAKWLDEVVENRNIVRSEKVCVGTYVTRTAIKYSRATKVQVPLLMAMLYALTCLLFPKAWIGFDWNPDTIEIRSERLIARNSHSQLLWELDVVGLVPYNIDTVNSRSIVKDFDGDGRNEALLLLSPGDYQTDRSFCALVKVGHDGSVLWDTLFSENPPIGDISQPNQYHFDVRPRLTSCTHLSNGDSSIQVLVMAKQHNTGSFAQIICFDPANCTVTGDYWHRGILTGCARFDLFGDGVDDLVFTGISNEYRCATLFAFLSDSLNGLLPPYIDEDGCKGSQVFYILFPKTMIAQILQAYLQQADIYRPGTDCLEIATIEISKEGGLLYAFDQELRVASIISTSSYKSALTAYWHDHRHLDSTLLFQVPSPDEIRYFDGKDFVNHWATCFPLVNR